MAIISVRDEAHWHELRAKHIGGSDVAALFGLSPYTTRWQLWMEKAGKLAPEDLSDNKAVQAGKFLESGIANWAAHRWGMTIDKVTEYYTVDDCPGMGASFDYITADGSPMEIKWSARGYGWHYNGEEIVEAPENYLMQVQHQLACTNADHAWLVALIDDEPRRMKVPRNDNIIDAIKSEISTFWSSIHEGEEPAIDFEKDVSALTKLMGTLPKSEIELDPSDALLFQEYKAAKEDEKKAIQRADEAKGELLTKVRAKLETMNTSKDKAVAKCGDYKLSISKVEDNPGKPITPDMVGTITGKRTGYVSVRIS
jgi:putative phage-type endonuclease